ncbi:hypothetical protein P7C70_g1889, partial [Phenoliferia sp. Uapishka_3]
MPPKPLVTLAAAAFCALSAGTNYAISSYAPQLAVRLGLSVTQLNVVSTSANLGMYLTGSIAGPIIDSRGPRIVLFFSALVLFTGWTLMRAFYDGGQEGMLFSHLGVPGVAFAQMLTGVGSSLGNGSAVNGVARSFTVKKPSPSSSPAPVYPPSSIQAPPDSSSTPLPTRPLISSSSSPSAAPPQCSPALSSSVPLDIQPAIQVLPKLRKNQHQ